MRSLNTEVTADNRRLSAQNTSLHEAHHEMSLQVARLQDTLNLRDTENAELKNQIDDLQYELMKVQHISLTVIRFIDWIYLYYFSKAIPNPFSVAIF